MSPDGRKPPRVFLSYAWESDAYKEQVEALATRLRANGINVRLDAWHALEGGLSIPEFMSHEAGAADRILVLCSPAYRNKVHATEGSERVTGVGLEQMLFWSEIWAGAAHRDKIVPALFLGEWIQAAPNLLLGTPYVDVRLEVLEANFVELLRRLTGRTKKAPTIGTLPPDLDAPPVTSLKGRPVSTPPVAPEANIAKLPATDATLIGRDNELTKLETAWQQNTNLIQIIAPGGTGKTALMTHWYKRHIGEVPIFGWSFYKQGTGDNANLSADDFLEAAVGHLDLTPKSNTADAKAAALVHHLRQQKTLLILDGLEPLQNQTTGELNDYALKDLLRELAVQNAGLVLCTSRVILADLADDAPLELDNLAPKDGARLLREKFHVHGSDEDLLEASKAYGNHALALTLLGTYLKRYGGDLSRRFEIDELPTKAAKPGDHAKRVMQSYAKQFAGQPEGDILRGLGFFDRPAERDALKLVLPNERLDEDALVTLQQARLILTADAQAPIDCHPLVREHFGALTKATDPEGFRAEHERLYEYYCKLPKEERPEGITGLTPLFHAVAHGCHAGRHQEVCEKVYRDRILRGAEAYVIHELGAFGTTLSLLAHFFEHPWSQPVSTLNAAAQAWVLNEAAFALHALGRLADAVEPMRAGAEAYVRQQNWKSAAIAYSNLSELLLTLGRTAEAVIAARQSVEYADRSQAWSQRMGKSATLANALHQASPSASEGRAEATRLFAEAEVFQQKAQPEYPLLYSLPGYQYCDLLLSQGDPAEAFRRATQVIEIARRNNWLLDIGLDHLTLGRSHAALNHEAEARHHLDQAVTFLRRSGDMDMLPLALLARGIALDQAADLEEVHRIATRSGMRLHLTDYHLAMAKRHNSLEHLAQAEKLIQETGYHRRDPEAAALRRELSG